MVLAKEKQDPPSVSNKMIQSWYCRLPGYQIVSVDGADARSFLQGQLSNNMDRLESGICMWNAYHQPDGRVLSLAPVLLRDDAFLLPLPREIAGVISRRLSRYVMRAKVEVGLAPLECAGLNGADLESAVAPMPVPGTGKVTHSPGGLCLVGYASNRVLVIGPPASAGWQRIADGLPEQPQSFWHLEDIRSGIPRITTNTMGKFTAQMLNLDLIGAISLDKGCYVGQEIIARTHNLGRVKRRMFRFSVAGDLTGSVVRLADDRKAGDIVTVTESGGTSDDRRECLAIVRLEHRQAKLYCDGASLTSLELPYRVPAG